VFAAADISGT